MAARGVAAGAVAVRVAGAVAHPGDDAAGAKFYDPTTLSRFPLLLRLQARLEQRRIALL